MDVLGCREVDGCFGEGDGSQGGPRAPEVLLAAVEEEAPVAVIEHVELTLGALQPAEG